jgi:hypothetical protein
MRRRRCGRAAGGAHERKSHEWLDRGACAGSRPRLRPGGLGPFDRAGDHLQGHAQPALGPTLPVHAIMQRLLPAGGRKVWGRPRHGQRPGTDRPLPSLAPGWARPTVSGFCRMPASDGLLKPSRAFRRTTSKQGLKNRSGSCPCGWIASSLRVSPTRRRQKSPRGARIRPTLVERSQTPGPSFPGVPVVAPANLRAL